MGTALPRRPKRTAALPPVAALLLTAPACGSGAQDASKIAQLVKDREDMEATETRLSGLLKQVEKEQARLAATRMHHHFKAHVISQSP
eukprot:gene8589-6244_t